MRRQRLIKATAWINAGIMILSMYTALNIPDHLYFAIAAFVASTTWMVAYVMQNLKTIVEPRKNRKIKTALAAVLLAIKKS